MPDLGVFATEVLAAYGLSIGLLLIVILLSWRRSRKVRAQLEAVEERRGT